MVMDYRHLMANHQQQVQEMERVFLVLGVATLVLVIMVELWREKEKEKEKEKDWALAQEGTYSAEVTGVEATVTEATVAVATVDFLVHQFLARVPGLFRLHMPEVALTWVEVQDLGLCCCYRRCHQYLLKAVELHQDHYSMGAVSY
jgi:hypothetical protein